jgi:hypothetical protein
LAIFYSSTRLLSDDIDGLNICYITIITERSRKPGFSAYISRITPRTSSPRPAQSIVVGLSCKFSQIIDLESSLR